MGPLPLKDRVEVPFPVSDVPGGAGLRLDSFLARRLHRYSRAEVQRMVSDGRVFLMRGHGDVKPAKSSCRLGADDVVIIRYPRPVEPEPRRRTLKVLYEDDAVLAADKPWGVLSHPTDKVLRNAATTILAGQFPGRRLHLAHRLDRETSGVLLLAKDTDSARSMQRQFEERSVRKEYLALVRGRVGFCRKTVDAAIGREGGVIRVRQAAGVPDAQPAVTDFELVSAGEDLSLVRAAPRTGRLHQIRVHLALLGHPVIGDKLYTGSGESYLKAVERSLTEEDFRRLGAPRQMLHAYRLTFSHPKTGQRLTAAAPLPEDFESFLGPRSAGAR